MDYNPERGSALHPDPPRKPRKPRKQPNIPQILSAKLDNPNLSSRQIAKITGDSDSNICKVLKRYGITKPRTDDYKLHRADILAGLQSRIVEAISAEDLQKADLRSKVVSAGILFDKERLERGQSTHNLAHLFSLAEVEE